MSDLAGLIPLVLIVVVFWLFIVRPARKKQQQFSSLQDELQPGLEVMTTSGIFAEIVSLDDLEARLRIADGVEIRVHRQAIGQIVRPEPAADPEIVEGD
ncbi:preprotein translocase subunit YajC [Aeromicrobium alkaliterrae]|uniref:Preprotein translocase subunit YajC n=1 Tax=Aeromicrobium alkaliterrae TaxID=302168 RepID=A0ABN2JJ66_9ACTN